MAMDVLAANMSVLIGNIRVKRRRRRWPVSFTEVRPCVCYEVMSRPIPFQLEDSEAFRSPFASPGEPGAGNPDVKRQDADLAATGAVSMSAYEDGRGRVDVLWSMGGSARMMQPTNTISEAILTVRWNFRSSGRWPVGT